MPVGAVLTELLPIVGGSVIIGQGKTIAHNFANGKSAIGGCELIKKGYWAHFGFLLVRLCPLPN